MTIRHARATGNINQNIIRRDVSDVISFLNQGVYPIVFLSQKPQAKDTIYNPKTITLNKRTTDATRFEWIEDEMLANDSVLAAGAAADLAVVELTVADASIFLVNDLIMVVDDVNNIDVEQCLVESVNTSTNVLTVKRAYDEDNVPASLDAGFKVFRLGPAFGEGSGAGDTRSRQKDLHYNFVQYFRTPLENTTLQRKIGQYGPYDPTYQKFIKGVEHIQELERQFLIGRKSNEVNPVTGLRTTTTEGIITRMRAGGSNFFDALGGAITKDLFLRYMSEAFYYTKTRDKLMLVTSGLSRKINMLFEEQVRFSEELKKVNINAGSIETADGRLTFIKHPLLDSMFGEIGITLEMPEISYVVFADEDTAIETVMLENNVKKEKEEYITHAGVEVRLPKLHSALTNFSVV